MTAMQNVLQATTLSDNSSLSSDESPLPGMGMVNPAPSWTNIDHADSQDPSYSSEYAPEIYSHMRQREVSDNTFGVISISIFPPLLPPSPEGGVHSPTLHGQATRHQSNDENHPR